MPVNRTSDQNVIEVENVTFAYPSQEMGEPALEDVSLRVDARDFLGIIGPNGGGKTTLLLLILGLLKPQRGSVKVFGLPPAQGRRRIGYVPQHAGIDLSAPASVLDVVLTGRVGESSWGPRFTRRHLEAAESALQQTGTADLAKRPIGSLSGGQRQRVLIARALAADARALLLDEPTAGIDAHMEQSLTDLLHRLNESLPIVMVSHDVSFVSRHLKRVACLNRRLTSHPAAEVTQEVIAEMYHGDIRAVLHDESCPLAEPGCDYGCSDDEDGPASGSGPRASANPDGPSGGGDR
ncbi:MAG: ATP-binding cassette domain-containing protein [Phycisphaerales bacterium]|nr:MAG: ATP-binding cassette domain-containing protein [Phycisphaerales bacterium]